MQLLPFPLSASARPPTQTHHEYRNQTLLKPLIPPLNKGYINDAAINRNTLVVSHTITRANIISSSTDNAIAIIPTLQLDSLQNLHNTEHFNHAHAVNRSTSIIIPSTQSLTQISTPASRALPESSPQPDNPPPQPVDHHRRREIKAGKTH